MLSQEESSWLVRRQALKSGLEVLLLGTFLIFALGLGKLILSNDILNVNDGKVFTVVNVWVCLASICVALFSLYCACANSKAFNEGKIAGRKVLDFIDRNSGPLSLSKIKLSSINTGPFQISFQDVSFHSSLDKLTADFPSSKVTLLLCKSSSTRSAIRKLIMGLA
mmetsp:Transcript_30443/g.22588  ORF Transcript_30443/g.22588 Transcript_30443/m.22588 type:complete len:166 (-) Transcript_30443:354-851(-)